MYYLLKAHGFNDKTKGKGNIDKDKRWFERKGVKVDTDSMDYGYWRLMWVRFRRHEPVIRMVMAIEKALDSGSSVVIEGYSNGWNYALQALDLVCDESLVLRPNQKILMIGVHPAGLTRPNIPPCVSAVRIYYTRSDSAVRAAGWASFLRLVPNWGRLGYSGYKGKDPRVSNRDMTNIARGHGSLYQDLNYVWFAKEKHEWVMSQLS